MACVLDRCLSPLPFPLIKRFLPLYLPLFLPAYYLLVILYINCRLLSQLCSLLRPLLARLGCRRIQPKPFSLIVRAHTRNVRVTFLARPLCPGELIERGIFLFFFLVTIHCLLGTKPFSARISAIVRFPFLLRRFLAGHSFCCSKW